MMTTTEAAAKIGCSDKALASWLRALGMLVTCTRCHGSGKYSFNRQDGDKCFGCRGTGTMMPKLTAKVVDEASARVVSGEMAPHLAKWRAQNAAKKSIAGLVAEGRVIYETIGNAYTAALDAKGGHLSDIPVCIATAAAQRANNDLFFFGRVTGYRSERANGGSLSGLAMAVQYGERTDYVAMAREARQIVAALRGLRIAYLAWQASQAMKLAA